MAQSYGGRGQKIMKQIINLKSQAGLQKKNITKDPIVERPYSKLKIPVALAGIGDDSINRLNKLQRKIKHNGQWAAYSIIRQLKHGETNWRMISAIAANTNNRDLATNLVAVLGACNRDEEIVFVMTLNADKFVQQFCEETLAELEQRFYKDEGMGFENGHEVIAEHEKIKIGSTEKKKE